MDFPCPHCTEVLLSHSTKANHIRWKHKQPGYSPEGLERVRDNIRKTNKLRSQSGVFVTETRICKCGQSFDTSFKTNHKWQGRKTCSTKCAKQREHTEESKQQTRESVKKWIETHPEEFCEFQQRAAAKNKDFRRSSKAERALAEKLRLLDFRRGRVVRTSVLSFAVDMMSADGRVWIESDGEWHFRQVHAGHDFEKTQLRDRIEEEEAIKRDVLLIRVDNQKFSLDEQLVFIWNSVAEWNGFGAVRKLL